MKNYQKPGLSRELLQSVLIYLIIVVSILLIIIYLTGCEREHFYIEDYIEDSCQNKNTADYIFYIDSNCNEMEHHGIARAITNFNEALPWRIAVCGLVEFPQYEPHLSKNTIRCAPEYSEFMGFYTAHKEDYDEDGIAEIIYKIDLYRYRLHTIDDIQSTTAHELGHVVGMQHPTTDVDSVMQPGYNASVIYTNYDIKMANRIKQEKE
jgi:hypothetical protein